MSWNHEPPRYNHDCDKCTYLGQYEEYDLYFCSKFLPTVIARYGNDGPLYTSGMALRKFVPPLQEAYERACELGLVKEDGTS
jgi:hypothetical protein